VHGYENDGVTPGSPSASIWQGMYGMAHPKGKTVWMTETSGYDNSWTDGSNAGAFTYGTGMYTALKFGHVSVWSQWGIGGTAGTASGCFINGGVPNWGYYAAKHFYRWTRPDAVMVDAAPSDTNILALAFNHKQNRTLTVVLINKSSTATSVTLSGYALPLFNAFRTSATEKCVTTGAISSDAPVTLPAMSFTTLYGQNWVGRPVAALIPQRADKHRQTPTGKIVGVTGLDGRAVRAPSFTGRMTAGGPAAARAAGVYIVKTSTGRVDAAIGLSAGR
jgi:glucuronoarabinoxylan endo-1,4-beta-xylanase